MVQYISYENKNMALWRETSECTLISSYIGSHSRVCGTTIGK